MGGAKHVSCLHTDDEGEVGARDGIRPVLAACQFLAAARDWSGDNAGNCSIESSLANGWAGPSIRMPHKDCLWPSQGRIASSLRSDNAGRSRNRTLEV
jgi:hypothetical protein